jgi:hypothetical protein
LQYRNRLVASPLVSAPLAPLAALVSENRLKSRRLLTNTINARPQSLRVGEKFI